MEDEWVSDLKDVKVVIWFCPDRADHGYEKNAQHVEWRDGIAHCLAHGCNQTSEKRGN